MQHFLAVAVAVSLSASAAEAAVYNYDVEMELTNLTLSAEFSGDGEIPGWLSDSCSEPQAGASYFYCGFTSVNLTEDRHGIPDAQMFDQILIATLRLDTEFSRSGGEAPVCSGSSFICGRIDGRSYGSFLSYSASPSGFYTFAAYIYEYMNFDISSGGIQYEDDGYYDGNAGFVSYFMGSFKAEYETTSLNIASVPLPASLPLLGFGLAAVGIAGRRRKADRAA